MRFRWPKGVPQEANAQCAVKGLPLVPCLQNKHYAQRTKQGKGPWLDKYTSMVQIRVLPDGPAPE